MNSYLVFYGTQTTIVRATTEHKAWILFCQTWAPTPARGQGHFARPVREEVRIRRPRESDRGWIEDSGDPRFLALLKELVDA